MGSGSGIRTYLQQEQQQRLGPLAHICAVAFTHMCSRSSSSGLVPQHTSVQQHCHILGAGEPAAAAVG
eukprot:353149-Chlamydomonas_euryale.AAC.1